jgi:methionyl-tRNA formyltransferase
MLKTIFLGTPALAVPFLNLCRQKSSLAAIVTTPDQPAGRGYDLKASAVKLAAQKLSIPIFQPETLKNTAAAEQIRAVAADVGIVVAYGKLLPKDVLAIPKYGFLNIHFSLLPKYRGAAPIQWALVNGETETGVTLFWLDEGMDTGPTFIQKKIPIQSNDDADSLRNKLVELGVESLEEALNLLEQGKIKKLPQSGASSKAPILKKEDGQIDWSASAEAIWNRMRGLQPWPGSYAGPLKILKALPVLDTQTASPGTVVRLVSGEGPVVKCGQNSLALLQVQPEGKKAMSAWSWWQGARLNVGARIG